MRKVLLVAAGALILAPMLTGSANAQAAFPTKALTLSAWMARSYDQCTAPGGLSVIVPGITDSGCLAANSTTDSSTNMGYARVRVSRNPAKIKLYGHGFAFGDVVRVRLQLRVTKSGASVKHPPASGQHVTFADQTIDCPKAPDAFTVRPNGAIAASTNLDACLSPYTGLAGALDKKTNIEVLSVSLVNAVSGKELAHSGVVR